MHVKQSCHIVSFSFLALTLLIPSKALADGLGLPMAVAVESTNCLIGNATQSNGATGYSNFSDSCDLVVTGGGIVTQAVGTTLVTLGVKPTVDVMASMTDGGYTLVGVEAKATWYTAVESIGTPLDLPPDVTIPVFFSWTGETQSSFPDEGNIYAGFDHKHTSTPGVYSFNLVPGTQYEAGLDASCEVGNASENLISNECQAVADPGLTFDQAAFNAEMGSNTFPLAEYYSIEYSPNLTAKESLHKSATRVIFE